MKKFFVLVCLVLAGLSLSSCKDDGGIKFLYEATVVGDADGKVDVSFPDGNLDVNGTAVIDFRYGNVSSNSNLAQGVSRKFYSMEDALVSDNKKVKTFAESITDQFNVAAANGTYYIKIKGYVKEVATGIVISIDKTFTNRSLEPEVFVK